MRHMLLLPLEVMPGWPEAEPESAFTLLLIMVIAPIVTGAVITLLAFGPQLARGTKNDGGTDPVEGQIY